jgi:hypothetical protein
MELRLLLDRHNLHIVLLIILILPPTLSLKTRMTTLVFIASMNQYATRTDVNPPYARNHMVLFLIVYRKIPISELVERVDPCAMRVRRDSLEIFLLLDPHVQLVDFEILCLGFQAVVQIVVVSVSFGVVEREDLGAAHETEEMCEEIGVRVDEVAAVGFGGPCPESGELTFEVPGSVNQSIGSRLDSAAADAEGHDFWVGIGGEADAAAVILGVVGDIETLHGYWIRVLLLLKLWCTLVVKSASQESL